MISFYVTWFADLNSNILVSELTVEKKIAEMASFLETGLALTMCIILLPPVKDNIKNLSRSCREM